MPAALQDLRERLAEARALGEHPVAYHALAAVLHAGEALRHLPTLDLVERRAQEHADWLGLHDTGHPLSPQSAATRGHHSVFEQLAVTAAAARARLKAEEAMRK